MILMDMDDIVAAVHESGQATDCRPPEPQSRAESVTLHTTSTAAGSGATNW